MASSPKSKFSSFTEEGEVLARVLIPRTTAAVDVMDNMRERMRTGSFMLNCFEFVIVLSFVLIDDFVSYQSGKAF
jgi:hypothetical protein